MHLPAMTVTLSAGLARACRTIASPPGRLRLMGVASARRAKKNRLRRQAVQLSRIGAVRLGLMCGAAVQPVAPAQLSVRLMISRPVSVMARSPVGVLPMKPRS